MDKDTTLLQLFARLPQAGRVKTRLAEELGEQRALEIYLHCLRHNLDLLDRMQQDYQLWIDRPGEHPLFDGRELRLQQGEDLGARMSHAIGEGLRSHHRVLLLGSDCLDMNPRCLNRAAQRLRDHDLVLIPAEDGGFVLIGSRRPLPPTLFDAVAWGSERVLSKTLVNALASGLAVAVLNPLKDIDRAADLAQYPLLAEYC